MWEYHWKEFPVECVTCGSFQIFHKGECAAKFTFFSGLIMDDSWKRLFQAWEVIWIHTLIQK